MSIVNTFSLQSNRQIKINFDGGDLSSDAGFLLIKEFAAKIGFTKLIEKKFKTNDKSVRFHKDYENLLQMIYQVISAYFQDDCADELTLDPVFNGSRYAGSEKRCPQTYTGYLRNQSKKCESPGKKGKVSAQRIVVAE